ncbi:MAG: pentapeptide repeat-containing protein, partial [Acidobacteriota bacterium]
MANYEHVRKLLEGTESWNASVEEQRAEDSNWRADLRGVNLARTDLIGANLTGAYLTGADLTDADLRRADLRRADLR